MSSFSTKVISNPLSVGEQLKKARLTTGASLKEIATEINVSLKYLQALESGDHKLFPGDVYAKNFLKAYLKFLQLDEKDFIDKFASEQTIYTKTSTGKDFKKPVARISRINLLVAPKVLRGIIIFLLAVGVLVYLGIEIKAIVAPPVLVVSNPAENLQISYSFIEVTGVTEQEAILSINGQQVLIDEQGRFNELIDLQTGVNIIEVTAKKRHGEQTTIYRQVVVEEVLGPFEDQEGEENENKLDPSASR